MAKQATKIQTAFDPKTTTLRQALDLYINESKITDATAKSLRSVFTRTHLDGNTKKVVNKLPSFLDQPVLSLFETVYNEEDNPLISMFEEAIQKNVDEKATARSGVWVAVNNIEDNVKRMMLRKYPTEEFLSLTETVVKPKLGVRYGKRFAFNTEKIGEFRVKVALEAVKNPKKEGLARLALFLLDTGFRPSMGRNAPFQSYSEPQKTFTGASNVAGIYLDATVEGVKMGNEVNVPYGPLTNANVQSMMNSSLKTTNKLDFLFVNSDGSQITQKQLGDFVKSIKVKGIMEDRENLINGQPSPIDHYKAGAAEFRRANATSYRNIGVSTSDAGSVKGRVGAATAGDTTQEIRYRSAVKGAFDAKDVTTVSALNNYFWMQQTDVLQKMGFIKEGQSLNPNTDLIDALKQTVTDKTKGKIVNPNYLIDVTVDARGHFVPVDPNAFKNPNAFTQDFIFPSQISDEILKRTETPIIEDVTSALPQEVNSDIKKASDGVKKFFELVSKSGKGLSALLVTPTAAKLAGSLAGGATTTIPVVAEAVVSEAFSPSPMGKEEIDPLTGESYRIATGPESRNLSEEEILKRSRMAKGQLELSQGQKTLLRGAAQKYMIDKTKGQSVETGTDTFDKTQLGQSFITGSDNSNFLNMEENNAGK